MNMIQHTNKLKLFALFALIIAGLTSALLAQNKQDYNMDNVKSEHYIEISREQIEEGNLPLAKVYAKKAVKANVWNAKAWANYDDITQRLADEGGIEDFETFIENSEAAKGPAVGGGGAKFEGC
jgi:hypothetical protein